MSSPSRLSRGLAYLTRTEVFLPLAALTMELCWAYPWLLWSMAFPKMPWDCVPLSLPSSILLLAASYAAARATGQRGMSFERRVAYPAAALLLFLVLLRTEHGGGIPWWDLAWLAYARAHLLQLIMGWLFGFYLMWRGGAVGQEPVGFNRLYRTFTFGLGALAFLLILWGITAASETVRPPGILTNLMIALFFFAGLSSLALSNFIAMQEEAARLGKRAQGLSERWTSLFFLIALAIALLGFAVANTPNVDVIAIIKAPLAFAASIIGIILVYVIGYPLGYIAAVLVFVLRWILAQVVGDKEPPQIGLPRFRMEMTRQDRSGEEPNALLNILEVMQWVVLFALIALSIYLVVRFLMRSRVGRARQDFEETSESIFTVEQFWLDVLSFWNNLLARLQRRLTPPARPKPEIKPAQAVDDGRVLRTREIYRALLAEGERAGVPKEQAETPAEYAGRLGRFRAEAIPDLEVVTEGYVRERYGSVPTPEERVPLMNQVWRRLRGLLAPPGLKPSP